MKLEYNSLYYFRYKPVGEGSLIVYDRTPLVMILDVRQNSILGLNFHWIPKAHKLEFFDSIREIMAKTHTVHKKKERMRLTYKLLQKPKFKVGLQAIRMYYNDGITMLKNIPEAQWDIAMGISQLRARKVYREKGYKE
jgi:hypothetical protein